MCPHLLLGSVRTPWDALGQSLAIVDNTRACHNTCFGVFSLSLRAPECPNKFPRNIGKMNLTKQCFKDMERDQESNHSTIRHVLRISFGPNVSQGVPNVAWRVPPCLLSAVGQEGDRCHQKTSCGSKRAGHITCLSVLFLSVCVPICFRDRRCWDNVCLSLPCPAILSLVEGHGVQLDSSFSRTLPRRRKISCLGLSLLNDVLPFRKKPAK